MGTEDQAPYWDNGIVRLWRGDCREALASMAAGGVHCVVTSPPYWCLRDYNLEPLIWGGDKGCGHEWGAPLRPGTKLGLSGNTNGNYAGGLVDPTKAYANAGKAQESKSCKRCNAWRGSLGLEPAPELYVQHIVQVMQEIRRVLRNDGTVWLNMGDGYAGSSSPGSGLKPKDLDGMPWRVALALQADGWWLRSDIIWAKPNQMPESVTDRPTTAHEYLFLLAKAADYFYDAEAIKESSVTPPRAGGPVAYRNRRSVWTIPLEGYHGAHDATFPQALVEPAILAGTSERGVCALCGAPWARVVEHENMQWVKGPKRMHNATRMRTRPSGTQDRPAMSRTTGWAPGCAHADASIVPSVVLDPFAGTGTTGVVAQRLGRRAVLIEASEDYCTLAVRRLQGVALSLHTSAGSAQEDAPAHY